MSDSNLPIGIMIKTARVIRRLEQFDIQGLTGIHRSYISVIENGKMLPTPAQIQALEAALGISFSDPEVQAAFLVLLGNSQEAPNAS